jgi:hypothetical protein
MRIETGGLPGFLGDGAFLTNDLHRSGTDIYENNGH